MKKIRHFIELLMFITIFLFVGIIFRYRNGDVDEIIPETSERELVILSYYQEKHLRTALKKIIEKYESYHPDIKIRMEYVLPSEFEKEICMEKDNNSLADLIICDNVMTSALVSMDIFQDVSFLYTAQKEDRLLQTAYGSTLVNGKSYGIPFTCDPYVLFYNKEYYQKKGIQKPDNMEEFIRIFRSVKTLGNYNFAFAGKDADDLSAFFLQMIYQYGGTILDLNGQNSMDFYKTLEDFRDYQILPRDLINWNQQDLMANFSSGFVLNVAAKLSSVTLLKNDKPDFSYGIMEIPFVRNQAYLMNGENIGVTCTPEDTDVLEFLDYLTSEESVNTFCEYTGKLSVYVEQEKNPGERYGLETDYIRKLRYHGMEKKSYSSWFMISSAIKNQITNFIGDPSVEGTQAANETQNAVRDAIMER